MADPLEQLHQELLREVEVERTGWAGEMVSRAAARINAARTAAPLEAVLIWINDAQAFTLPGRHVYLSRQLLSRGLGEAGVAFVLAHEMAHHDLGHLAAAQRAWEASAQPWSLGKLGAYARAILHAQIHSPDFERDADRLALELCRRAGYGDAGAHDAFDLLELVALDFRDVDGVFGHGGDGAALPRGLSVLLGRLPYSHPSIAARRAHLWPPTKPALAPRRPATRMVVVCAPCRVRFSPAERCPRCGRGDLLDLRKPTDRSRLPSRINPALVEGGRAAQPYRLTPVAPPAEPGLSARGTLRVVEPAESPLGGVRCAAWRVWGEGPSGVIDDGGLGSLELYERGLLVARAVAVDGAVDIALDAVPRAVAIEGRVADFLAQRGVVRDHAQAALSESVLVGGRAELSGPAQRVRGGRRGWAPEVLVFQPGVVLRRA